jgi:hypothetical protein
VETFIFISICYWLMGLRPEPAAFAYTFMILVVTCNTAAACGKTFCITVYSISINLSCHFQLGTFFSAAFQSVAIAISILIPFDYILFITGGVLISLKLVKSNDYYLTK